MCWSGLKYFFTLLGDLITSVGLIASWASCAPFDLFFAKGILAEFQLAGFYEQGTVSPDLGKNFWRNFKDSYGLGIRFITGSAVGRLDFGFSDEGGATTAYWGYPF